MTRTVRMDLICDLSEGELFERGEQLSAINLEYDKVEKARTKGERR